MYQALYRKYRPINFDTVIGQDVIVKILKNSIINNNFSHAYLFFGPRGTGKTTLSKIFARNINCLNPINGNACGKCSNCKDSFSKDCLDIIEIDAASNNGVDEIRELRNNVSLVPNNLKYKVYIIDEVHMLSIGAFNALLKTLEEPPEHVVFILATTESHKVPDTIVSRCQCYSFKNISNDNIIKNLKMIVEKEKVKIDDEVLNNIAIQSDGGMRDALSLLDKLISYNSNHITLDDFINVNGIVSYKELDLFLNSILEGNEVEVIKLINYFNNRGKSLVQIIIQLLNYCRDLMVDYIKNNSTDTIEINKLNNFSNFLNINLTDIKKASNKKVYIELLLLNYIITNKNIKNVVENRKNEDIKEIREKSIDFPLEKKKQLNDYNQSFKNKLKETIVTNIDEIMSVRINNTLALADKKILKDEQEKFNLLKDYTFDQEFGYIVCNLLDSKLRVASKDSIIISYDLESTVEQNLKIINLLTKIYNNITNSSKKIAIISDNKWNELRKEYINNIKNEGFYKIMPEPEEILEELVKNDIISSSAVDLFGDIVEFE